MARVAIVVAAGRGTRAGNSPKQFLPLAGRTVLWHAVRPFAANPDIDSVRIITTLENKKLAAKCAEELPRAVEILATGGATRAASVRNGLRGLAAEDWAVVHDAARPCLSDSALARLLSAAANDDVGALLALPLTDALKESSADRAKKTLPRKNKYLAQTPQMFRAGALRTALRDDCEDESRAMEEAGFFPLLVEGETENIKITRAKDFLLAAAILTARAK